MMNLKFTTRICGKSSLGLSYFHFVKFSFLVTHLMPCYSETGCFRPPNRVTLQITLLGLKLSTINAFCNLASDQVICRIGLE
jgi:hypothetical protein